MTAGSRDWTSGWQIGATPSIDYVWSPSGHGPWTPRPGGGEARDLGLGAASEGLLAGHEIRLVDGGAFERDAGTDDLRFLFVVEGGADLRPDHGHTERLRAWSTVCTARGNGHTVTDIDPGFRAVEIRVPGDAREGAPSAGGTSITHEADDQYVLADGPRAYFDYRDLRTRAVTDERIHIHLVRATQSVTGGTGWHVHTMSQWFMVLRGEGIISVAGHGDLPISAGDSMCLGAGLRHDVSEFSDDYLVLEMCVPAEYETTGTAAP